MQHNLAVLGSRPLGEICLPGAHDAGAFKLEFGTTIGGVESNVLTQTLSIYGQLEHGVRWMEIRPFLLHRRKPSRKTESNWYCGHFSDINFGLDWQGGCGATIDEVVADVNRFTSEHPELVILDISHITFLECDVGLRDFGGAIERSLTPDQRHELLTKLASIHNRFHVPAGQLESLTLDTFIGQRQPAVLVVFDPDTDKLFVNEAELTERQFYRSERYAVNKHFVTRMQTDLEAASCTLLPNRWVEPMQNPSSVLRLADAYQAQEFPFTLIIIDKVERGDLLTLCLAVSFARVSPRELVVVYGGVHITDTAARQRMQDTINARRAVDITNSLCGGDPWEGTFKSLAVVYWHDGWVKARFGREGTTLHLERDYLRRPWAELEDQAVYYENWRRITMS
ncbi:PLC-like phosphodiesterase [Mycena metata]|uniref:PLC-like phosphodiesterase n=1 Tax=Mycena metata TaxID=1033252 RepID=A0AAD7J5Z6_9AGAR|nr:PLC-like phosphodiesterase [Mycena metata]